MDVLIQVVAKIVVYINEIHTLLDTLTVTCHKESVLELSSIAQWELGKTFRHRRNIITLNHSILMIGF